MRRLSLLVLCAAVAVAASAACVAGTAATEPAAAASLAAVVNQPPATTVGWAQRSAGAPGHPQCMWLNYSRHDAIRAWELQASPHRHMVRDRDRAIRRLEGLLRDLTKEASGVQFVEQSRYMAIFRERAFQVSTRHGHPLRPRDKEQKHSQPFPWKGLGYLRLREYKLLTPAGAYVPASMPGTADLTFKMKKIDPDKGVEGLELPSQVGGSSLTAKLEWDGHCDHGRISMSPLYRPVDQSLNISRIGNVKEFFPNLAAVARLDEQMPLPFMHDVYRAKIMWTVVFEGVIGEANLVIKYNTTFEDAVAGARPKNGEVSLRIRRDVAEATGTTGEEGKKQLFAALDALGRAMQVLRDKGWDGKTPGLQASPVAVDTAGSVAAASTSKGHGCGCKCSCCGCDCKHGGDSQEAAAAAAGDGSKCGCGCKHCGGCAQQAAAAALARPLMMRDAKTAGQLVVV